MRDPVDLTYAFNLAPEDAVNYFRQKGYAFSWDWHEVWQDAHSRAFTVAKAVKLDILQDIRGAVDKAIADGTTFAQFQKELEPILRAKGWWGKQLTADGKIVQLGNPYRLETIYRTNVQSAYMAGRYKQQMENADDRPFIQYVSVLDSRTRPSHAALHGKVFRFDDPFWDTHYPPIAYRCRCRTRALTERQVTARGLTVETGAGRMVWEDKPIGRKGKGGTRPVAGYRDPDTGDVVSTDPGWSSNPGRAWMIDSGKYDADIARLI